MRPPKPPQPPRPPAGQLQSMSTGELLEPDYREAYSAWKADPSPEQNSALLKSIHPVIEGAIHAHVGQSNPLIVSRARKLALDAMRGYDPTRSRLRTHLYNQLQSLKRVNRQQNTIVHVPERLALDRYQYEAMTKDLSHELGREPTDQELMDKTGFSPRRIKRIRSYTPAVAEGQMVDQETGQPVGYSGAVVDPNREARTIWSDLVYDELSPQDKKIMEYAFGLNGRRALQNQEIARKLGRSPGLISQRKLHIQKLLDREGDLSPFTGAL